MKIPSSKEFIKVCKEELVRYHNEREERFNHDITIDDVYVVWYCKTLQNHKALLSTNVSGDGAYYEFTYNGDKEELYLDAYKKKSNMCIR